MTGPAQLTATPRDRFLARGERGKLIAFERREREFMKQERQERAADLGIQELAVMDRRDGHNLSA